MKSSTVIKSSKTLQVFILVMVSFICSTSTPLNSNPVISQDQNGTSPYSAIYKLLRLLSDSANKKYQEKVKKWVDIQTARLQEIERTLLPETSFYKTFHEALKALNAELNTLLDNKRVLNRYDLRIIHPIIVRCLGPLIEDINYQLFVNVDPIMENVSLFIRRFVSKFIQEDAIQFSMLAWVKNNKKASGITALIIAIAAAGKIWKIKKRIDADEEVRARIEAENRIKVEEKKKQEELLKNLDLRSFKDDEYESDDEDSNASLDQNEKPGDEYVFKVGELNINLSKRIIDESPYLKGLFESGLEESITKTAVFKPDQLHGGATLTRDLWERIFKLVHKVSVRRQARYKLNNSLIIRDLCDYLIKVTKDNEKYSLGYDLQKQNDFITEMLDVLLIIHGFSISEVALRALIRFCFIKLDKYKAIAGIYVKLKEQKNKDFSALLKHFEDEYRSFYNEDLIKKLNECSELSEQYWSNVKTTGILDLSNSKITSLEGFESISEDCRNAVKKIILTNRMIMEIKKRAFTMFPNLNEIDLRWSNIIQIHEKAFSGVPDLSEVNLWSANIRIEDPKAYFAKSPLCRIIMNGCTLDSAR